MVDPVADMLNGYDYGRNHADRDAFRISGQGLGPDPPLRLIVSGVP